MTASTWVLTLIAAVLYVFMAWDIRRDLRGEAATRRRFINLRVTNEPVAVSDADNS